MAKGEWFEAQIYVDSSPLQEYSNDEPEPNERTTTRYVESNAGATFQIGFKLPALRAKLENRFGAPIEPTHGAYLSVHIDGKRVTGEVITFEQLETSVNGYMEHHRCVIDGQAQKQSFLFSTLAKTATNGTTDGGIGEESQDTHECIGQIALSLHAIKNVVEVEGLGQWPRIENTNPGTIPDNAPNGQKISHYTTFGEPISYPSYAYYKSNYREGKDNPLATVIFRYGSKDTLKALQIIPDSPSPSPGSVQTKQEAEKASSLHEGRNADLAFRPRPRTQAERAVEPARDQVADARSQDGLLHDLAFRAKKQNQQGSGIRQELDGDGGSEMTLAGPDHLQHDELTVRVREEAPPGTLIKRDREDGDEDGSGDAGEKNLVALPDRSKKPRRKLGSN